MQWTYIYKYRRRAANHGNYTLASTHCWTQTTSIQYISARYSSKYRSAGLLSLKGKGGKWVPTLVGRGGGQPQRKAWGLVLIGVLFSWRRRGRGDFFVLWWKLGRVGCTGCSGRGCSAATYCQLRLLVIFVLNASNQSLILQIMQGQYSRVPIPSLCRVSLPGVTAAIDRTMKKLRIVCQGIRCDTEYV